MITEISINIGRLPLKTIVPITHWSDNFIDYPWIIKLISNKTNGLSKVSAIDCFQIRNFSHNRFIAKIGVIDKPLLFSIHETIAKTLNPAYRLSII
jgi:mRNA interferase MazF